MKKMILRHPALRWYDEEKDAYVDDGIEVNGKMVVCPRCGGEGHHVRNDIDDSRLVDSMHEDGDYEGLERYFNGAYDQTCSLCNGKNVILDVDWDSVPEDVKKKIQDYEQWELDYQRECDAERRMGA